MKPINDSLTLDEGGKPLSPEKITEKEFDEIIDKAVSTYGMTSQTKMLFEEMAELQNAICKFARGRGTGDQVCEEIADVMIMCCQMARIFGMKSVARWSNRKMIRLKKRLMEGSDLKY